MSEGTLKIVALALFALMYVGIIGFPKWKTWYALGVAAVYVILGILPAQKTGISTNFESNGFSLERISTLCVKILIYNLFYVPYGTVKHTKYL